MKTLILSLLLIFGSTQAYAEMVLSDTIARAAKKESFRIRVASATYDSNKEGVTVITIMFNGGSARFSGAHLLIGERLSNSINKKDNYHEK